ncbi:hypothetical protein [Sporosarcina sp. FA9]|uniref:hypothetical protein n=1 Tax=Sporosarcina sp. FA9 TaxID=3413030 RepID=UPI003F65A0C4
MNKTIIFIILRVCSFIAIAFYVLHSFKLNEFNFMIDNGEITFEKYMTLKSGINSYLYILPIFLIVDGFYNLTNKKKRIDGTIRMKEYILPEFNHSDERESVLTGKAAKAGLAIILFYTMLVLVSYVFILMSTIPIATFMIFATASIPIVGLIAYYGSYRYYYTK